MARKLKKSTLFFRWNCFWNPVLAHGMKEPWNDLCWGNRNGLMITTLDTVPVLGSSSNDQRYHCCTLFPPMETPKCISIWSDIHPRALQSIFRFRGQRPSATLVPSLTSQSRQTGPEKTCVKHWLRRWRHGGDSICNMHTRWFVLAWSSRSGNIITSSSLQSFADYRFTANAQSLSLQSVTFPIVNCRQKDILAAQSAQQA